MLSDDEIALRDRDRGGLRPEQVGFGKPSNTRDTLELCRTARTILGCNGISLEYPVSRAFLDARIQSIYGGTNEIMKTIIAKDLRL